MTKPAPNKPRPRYYLGCCFNGPGGTVAEVAISTKPVIQALPEVMYPACPICSNGHTITCAEVSFDQFMYGAAASAKDDAAVEELEAKLESTQHLARVQLRKEMDTLFENANYEGQYPGYPPLDEELTRAEIARLQLAAEELDLNWIELVSRQADGARGRIRQIMGHDYDG